MRSISCTDVSFALSVLPYKIMVMELMLNFSIWPRELMCQLEKCNSLNYIQKSFKGMDCLISLVVVIVVSDKAGYTHALSALSISGLII